MWMLPREAPETPQALRPIRRTLIHSRFFSWARFLPYILWLGVGRTSRRRVCP